MNLKVEETTIYRFPHAFVNKKGEAILITALDDERCQQLIEMYLAYEPKNSFQGLPPIGDEACVKWVRHMIGNGINLVARSFGEGVVGHTVLFPINNRVCEMLVAVSGPLQNTGIGTELTRCSIQMAHEIDFEKIRLSVQATNVRARHVYKKCGFEYVSYEDVGEVEMTLDLKGYRDAVDVNVGAIMNRDAIAIRDDEPCRTALQIFLNNHINSLPVIDQSGELVGIISQTDFMQPSKISKKVGDVLTREVLTVREECPMAKVIRMLQSKRVRSVPVVDRQKKLIGIIGRKEILGYYAKQL